ncbi:hypothetical protein AcidC75_10860 [Acidisoma sp. C75]
MGKAGAVVARQRPRRGIFPRGKPERLELALKDATFILDRADRASGFWCDGEKGPPSAALRAWPSPDAIRGTSPATYSQEVDITN